MGSQVDLRQAELRVRLEALRLNCAFRLPRLAPSGSLRQHEVSVAACEEFREEDMEGHCAPEQLEFLRCFVAQEFGQQAWPVRMCQVGFNAGHSAVALLDSAPEGSMLLSLDLANHPYTMPLEAVVSRIAEEQGKKHIFLKGDSLEMLPRFRHIGFDLVFIDGNHAYEAVKMDFLNSLQLATADTRLLLNHVFTDMDESKAPTRVWLEALQDDVVEQRGWHSCCGRHGIAVGVSRHPRHEGASPGRS